MNTQTVSDRFWAKVRKGDLCWEWTAAKSTGAGVFRLNGANVLAHRFAYEQLVGPIPTGLVLDHLCRNRACVRPDHLEPVTIGENVMRGEGACPRNARKTHCVRGHALSGSNIYESRLKHGHRICRVCASERAITRRRAAGKGKYKTHCKRGHVLSGENLCPLTLKEGRRRCLACTRESAHRRYLARKSQRGSA